MAGKPTGKPAPPRSRLTFGQLLQFLRGLGFVITFRSDKVVDCREPTSQTVLLFRGRPDDDLVRDHELYLARTQLTLRGVVTEAQFERFVEGAMQPTS